MRIWGWKLVRRPTLSSGLLPFVPCDCYTLPRSSSFPSGMHSFPHILCEERGQESISSLLFGGRIHGPNLSNQWEWRRSHFYYGFNDSLAKATRSDHTIFYNSCFYPHTFYFIFQAASHLLTESFFIYMSADSTSKQLCWALCLCHSR